MSFRRSKLHNKSNKTSLRAVRVFERAWLSRILQKGVRASMTVEAAVVLPLFLFCMAEILYVFNMIRTQSNMLAALHESGTQISEYCYFYRYGLSDILDIEAGDDTYEGETGADSGLAEVLASAAVSETFVRSRVASFWSENSLDESCLDGGLRGTSFLQSSILSGGDYVDLIADYRLKPFLPMFGLQNIPVQSRYYSHAWVGYDVGGELDDHDHDDKETYVYITETGTVYHRSRDCTYLKPSVHTVSAATLDVLRNKGGACYYPCEICHPQKSGMVVVTYEGNRYHSSASCAGLKRTVREVPLSSVEDSMRACSKCGGGD